MKSSYYLRNNVSLAIGVIHSALMGGRSIGMAELSLILPFLFDDKIVGTLNDKNQYLTIRSLITMNKIALANFNDRYLSLLPLVYQSLSILLDIDAVSISDGDIHGKNMKFFDDMVLKCDSRQLEAICVATERLLGMIEKKNLSGLYKTLKIEL